MVFDFQGIQVCGKIMSSPKKRWVLTITRVEKEKEFLLQILATKNTTDLAPKR